MKNPLDSLSRKTSKLRGSVSDGKIENTAEKLVFKTSAKRLFPTMAQLRYLMKLFSKQERIFFLVSVGLVLVGLPVFGVRAYFQATNVMPDFGGNYTEGLVGAPQYVNPVLSSLSDVDSDLASLIFSGIFKNNDQHQLEPDLITNYVVSDDELTYTFFLRNDVKWHDGEDFDADDVIFTVAAIQDPSYQSPLQGTLKEVVAEKLDDNSFSLTLPEPFAPFLSSLTFGIMPEHLWYNVPAQNVALTELNVKPIGTGPYKFESLVKDKAGNVKSFNVETNKDYYGDKPFLDGITFNFYLDPMSAVEALKSKKVEGLGFFPANQVEEVRENSNLEMYSLRIPQYTAIFFNQKESDVLQNDEVRKALSHATDRDRIIRDALFGQGESIWSAILPGYVGYNPDVKKYKFDMEKARALLKEGGWKYPEGAVKHNAALATGELPEVVEEEVDETAEKESTANEFIPRENDGVKLEFTVSTVDLPEYQATLAILQENWKEIGVKLNVNTFSPEDIQIQVVKDRNYEALLFGEIVGTDPDPYPFWHSSQQDHPGLALALFTDREVDQLLEEARKTTDEEERTTKYVHFANNIAEQVPAIFLYNPIYNYAINDKIKGVSREQYITVPSDRFTGATKWYVKTKREWK